MNSGLSQGEARHLVKLLKQKFISPYKIIYMVDQKQADYFKSRNQNNGCCSSSEITIPAGEQTKIQKQLAELISVPAIKSSLNEILQYCESRYENIVEKGKQDSLKITNEVEKYLIDNIMAESVNKFIHTKLVTKLTDQSKSMSTEIGLWATPATWYAKYPHIKLEILDPNHISQLFNQSYTVIEGKFNNFLTQAFGQLTLLEKDGKFQQLLWKSTEKSSGNETKILKNPMRYGNLQDENCMFGNIFRLCLLVQSLPFQLNMKANCYLTINDSIQAYYYNSAPVQANKKLVSLKYQIVLPVNVDLEVQLNKKLINIKRGTIFIVSNLHEYSFKCMDDKIKEAFIIRSYVNEAQRTN